MPNHKEYIPGKGNAFADFLCEKYNVNQPGNDTLSASNEAKTTDIVNVVKTRAKPRQKPTYQMQTYQRTYQIKINGLSHNSKLMMPKNLTPGLIKPDRKSKIR
uniref:Uncharacterized protein n=1 Tax=Romanomermis culicivorax TaxID=13658 RepID=A0A915IIU8_ROMCU